MEFQRYSVNASFFTAKWLRRRLKLLPFSSLKRIHFALESKSVEHFYLDKRLIGLRRIFSCKFEESFEQLSVFSANWNSSYKRMSITEIKSKANVPTPELTNTSIFSISVPHKAYAIKINTSFEIQWTDLSAEENYKGIHDSVPLCLKHTLNTHYVFIIAAIYSECVRDAAHTHLHTSGKTSAKNSRRRCHRLMYENTFTYFFIYFIFMRARNV